jgi:TonB family protein
VDSRPAPSHRALARARPDALVLVAILAVIVCVGCERSRVRRVERVRLPIDVFADTGRAVPVAIVPGGGGADHALDSARPPAAPAASVWLARVSPAAPDTLQPPAPAPAEPPERAGLEEPPSLEIDPGLKPPILRSAAPLRVPPLGRGVAVELDVRVDETGTVTDAEWAGGASDSLLVTAATECAQSMRFFPAIQAGKPVAVWCRQRFDFGRR